MGEEKYMFFTIAINTLDNGTVSGLQTFISSKTINFDIVKIQFDNSLQIFAML